MRNNVSFDEIEKALGYLLNDEQKKVLNTPVRFLWDMKAPPERCTGSTTAAVLRLLLTEGDTVITLDKRFKAEVCYLSADDSFLVKACCRYSGDDEKRGRYYHFCNEVIKLGRQLSEAGIDVREVWWNGYCSKSKPQKIPKIEIDMTDLAAFEERLDRLTEKMIRLDKLMQGIILIES